LKIKDKGRQNAGKSIVSPYSNSVSPETLHPYFSLRYLSKSHCLSKCQTAEKAAFADTLHRLSQLTWGQIKSAPRHGLGCELIARNSIQGVPAHLSQEVNLIAFRFHGKAPMVGYRDRATFYVIWLDPNFTLYDHG
jgi:hypothetical protein